MEELWIAALASEMPSEAPTRAEAEQMAFALLADMPSDESFDDLRSELVALLGEP